METGHCIKWTGVCSGHQVPSAREAGTVLSLQHFTLSRNSLLEKLFCHYLEVMTETWLERSLRGLICLQDWQFRSLFFLIGKELRGKKKEKKHWLRFPWGPLRLLQWWEMSLGNFRCAPAVHLFWLWAQDGVTWHRDTSFAPLGEVCHFSVLWWWQHRTE